METNRADLLKILEKVKPGLAKKEVVEQMVHFIFSGQDVITYNDMICIHHPFETDFNCSVRAKELYSQLAGDSSEIVELTLPDEKLIIKSLKQTTRLAAAKGENVEKEIRLIQEQLSKDTKWTSLPSDFVEGAYLCMFSTSRDETQGGMTCMKISKDRIFTTDGVRGSRYLLKADIDHPGSHFLLKGSIVGELNKFKFNRVTFGEGWVHFQTPENVVFSVRMLEGDIPAFEHMFEDLKKKPENISLSLDDVKDEMTHQIEVATSMTDGQIETDRAIRIILKDGEMTIKASKETGSTDKHIKMEYELEPIEFAINPIFFAQVLKKGSTLTVSKDMLFIDAGPFDHILAKKRVD